MPEVAAGNPPFRCGKCESRGLYRDDDRLNNASFIVCPICGNRWPGGPAPVMIEPLSKPKGEENMPSKKGTCANCCRPNMAIIAHDLCGTCNAVRTGRTGEALDKALADTKVRLWSAYQESLKGKEKPQSIDEPLPKTEENIPETIPHLSDEKTDSSDKSPKNTDSDNPDSNAAFSALRQKLIDHDFQEFKVTEGMREKIRSLGNDTKMWFPILNDAITIEFGTDDQLLLEYISGQAKKYRRTPDQQILYMIDCNRQADLEEGCSK
jgi:hypothetical protein